MWFLETPWPPLVLLGAAACVCVALWYSRRRAAWLAAAFGLALAGVAVWFVERAVVTEAERVERSVYDLAAAFKRDDREAVLSFFSLQADDLRQLAERTLDEVDVSDDLDVKDLDVRLFAAGSRAESHFRANGSFVWRSMPLGPYPSRWLVTWQNEGGGWKIIEVQRLNPINARPMEIFEQRP